MTPWIIQSSGLPRGPETIARMLGSLNAAQIPWKDFGLIDKTPEITNWEEFGDGPIYPHLSIRALRILTQDQFNPTEIFKGAGADLADTLLANIRRGIAYDEDRFDMGNYIEPLREHLLNGDARVMSLKEAIDFRCDTHAFIKPGKDLKLFEAMVLEPRESLRERILYDFVKTATPEILNENVIISPTKSILAEYRCFVFGNEVVAASQYRKDGAGHLDGDVPADILAAARDFAQEYQPAKAFVMDVCTLVDGQRKIVEYNCMNCAGLYKVDIARIAEAADHMATSSPAPRSPRP